MTARKKTNGSRPGLPTKPCWVFWQINGKYPWEPMQVVLRDGELYRLRLGKHCDLNMGNYQPIIAPEQAQALATRDKRIRGVVHDLRKVAKNAKDPVICEMAQWAAFNVGTLMNMQDCVVPKMMATKRALTEALHDAP